MPTEHLKPWQFPKKDLAERNNKIKSMRGEIVDGKQKTLQEIGRVFGITRQRTKQVLDELKK